MTEWKFIIVYCYIENRLNDSYGPMNIIHYDIVQVNAFWCTVNQ